jgi:Sigma-70, region 4
MSDFDEIVYLPGVGTVTLRTAIRHAMALPPPPPGTIRQTSIFRAEGCSPSIYDFADIERMAEMLDEIEQRDARNAKIAARRADGLSFEEIGQEVGLSGERVRQVVAQSARKAARNSRLRARWAGVFQATK